MTGKLHIKIIQAPDKWITYRAAFSLNETDIGFGDFSCVGDPQWGQSFYSAGDLKRAIRSQGGDLTIPAPN